MGGREEGRESMKGPSSATHVQALLEQLRATQSVSGVGKSESAKSMYSKIMDENERLQKSLRREMEQTEKLSVSLKTMKLQNERLKDEISEVGEEGRGRRM